MSHEAPLQHARPENVGGCWEWVGRVSGVGGRERSQHYGPNTPASPPCAPPLVYSLQAGGCPGLGWGADGSGGQMGNEGGEGCVRIRGRVRLLMDTQAPPCGSSTSRWGGRGGGGLAVAPGPPLRSFQEGHVLSRAQLYPLPSGGTKHP